MILYQRSCLIPASVEDVFSHSTSLEGFCQQFPFEVKWRSGPAKWCCDDELDFSYRVLGLWFTHKAKIVEFHPNERFIDEMTSGFYKYFRHTHTFVPEGTGTRVTDQVEFSMGFGKWLDRTIGWKTLDDTFAKRHRALRTHFQGGA